MSVETDRLYRMPTILTLMNYPCRQAWMARVYPHRQANLLRSTRKLSERHRNQEATRQGWAAMSQNIVIVVIVGFVAQMIDGAIGMAYGVSSMTFLLATGVPPVAASASVHMAQVFTTAVSGLSHLKLGNVDKTLFKKLLIPGVIGGILGAYILAAVPGKIVKPFVTAYLLVMGFIILLKTLGRIQERKVRTRLAPLALVGGFFDAVGGGGWGPIVTSSLLARGNNARLTIGSVNLAEFFVTLFESIAFIIVAVGLMRWHIIAGLIVGGAMAAPLAAYVCKKLSARSLTMIVGGSIALLAITTIFLP